MATVTMKQLLEAGVHFGHQVRHWNPKMSRFIFDERNSIHIIDLQKTVQMIKEAYHFIHQVVLDGGEVVLIGTKKQAQDTIREEAERAGIHYVSYKWLGGTLSNFETIKRNISRLKELEEMLEGEAQLKMSKKERTTLSKELIKRQKTISGIRELKDIPDAVFIIDPKRERVATAECMKLSIPIVALVDTNCDPSGISYPIPGNDDAIRAIKLITTIIADAVLEAKEDLGASNGKEGPDDGDTEKTVKTEEDKKSDDKVTADSTPSSEDSGK